MAYFNPSRTHCSIRSLNLIQGAVEKVYSYGSLLSKTLSDLRVVLACVARPLSCKNVPVTFKCRNGKLLFTLNIVEEFGKLLLPGCAS